MKRVRLNDPQNSVRTGGQKRARQGLKAPAEDRKVVSEFSDPPAGTNPTSRLRRHKGQWLEGVSGNRAGRKKGSRNKKTVIIEMMENKLGRKIPDLKKLSNLEGIFLKAIQKAMGGDMRASTLTLREYREALQSSGSLAVTATTEEDQQAYDAMREKIRREIEDEVRAALRAEILHELKLELGW